MSISQKHKIFIASPMDNQGVINAPGIGPAYANMLAQQGYMQVRKFFC